MRTTVTRVVLAAVVGLAMTAPAAPAFAQEPADPPVASAPADVPFPNPIITAIAVCSDGDSRVDVALEDRRKPYEVTLRSPSSGFSLERTTTFDDSRYLHLASFEPVPTGSYEVVVKGADRPSDGVTVEVPTCAELDPDKGELSVTVECKAGWGIATFEVANPSTGDVRNYELSLYGGSGEPYLIELAPGVFLRIVENLFDDGKYEATLSGDGFDKPLVKEFIVACEKDNEPRLNALAQCDTKDDINSRAPVMIDLHNPNRAAVDYTIAVAGQKRTVNVGGGSDAFVEMDPVAGGDYKVTVTGSDGTVTDTDVRVDHCEDIKKDDDGLQISSRCVDGRSIVTIRFFAVGPYPAKREFGIDGSAKYDETVEFTGDGVYQWSRYTGDFADGSYIARLSGSGLNTVENFTVACKEAPTTIPTSSDPSSSAPTSAPTGSTTPDPQGGQGPSDSDDNLPVTGTAVGAMVTLGLAALGLGGFLVFMGRRKRSA
ncbi:MAG: LPXTG cell wall anchor domain-containing protein [Actinomycetota bacterium]|nr:LPXTG cell wall anchor domain-containing protein [Actinomycetota bacterium]